MHLAVPINLAEVDIGRHIKNGELLFQGQTQILYKNFYSFTYPDYPFINHHWFFGVISFLLFHLAGFKGLEIFYIFLLVLSFGLSFDSARRYSSFNLALFAAGASLIMVVSRAEIRPEGISVFFVALFFWVLQRFLQGNLSQKVLITALPLFQMIWVNTHIFFFLGPVLIALFYWQARLSKAPYDQIAFLKKILLIDIIVNVINPSGIFGMLTPLNGFKKFGYDLAENQTAFFMMHRFENVFVYKYYFIVAAFLILGMVLGLWHEKRKALPMVVLALFITLAAFRAVRLIMPFGFLFIPLIGYFYGPYIKKGWMNVLVGIIAFAMILGCTVLFPQRPYLGLVPGINASADFFKGNNLKGPIFSNYDIGGYLIYYLGPEEKVFVDNRQEAFPVDFFRKVYIPMQSDPVVWKEMSSKYGFNLIYFFRRDLTPWGQSFLIDRIQDPLWAPIFVDDNIIMFARRESVNQEAIGRFELPKAMFTIRRF